jgi:hypothetical protein
LFIISNKMSGGLMQLVAYGAQDIYLTGNPQITFFKVVYRRHTNFSMEAIQQTVNGTSQLSASNTSGTVTIARNGDLVGRMYVRVDANDGTDCISGDQLIKDVTLEIGGQQIDKHTREWLQVWSELSTPESKAAGYKYLTGGFSNTLMAGGTTGGHSQQSVMVPLQFYFCRNPGLALPLIALQYHEVKVKFTWGTRTEASRDGSSGTAATCEVWADYIYLDTEERRRFAQVSHEYLIEQLQYQEESAAATQKIKLNFNHPVKELVWTNTSADVTTQRVKLTLNGHDRFAEQDREYFQVRQPLDHHTAVPGYNVKETERPVLSSTPVLFAHNAAALDTTDDAATVEITGAVGGATIELGSNFVGTIAGQTAVRVGDLLQVVNSIDGSTAADDTEYYQVVVTAVTAGTNALSITTVFDDAGSAITPTNTTTIDSRVSVVRVGRVQDPQSRCSQLAKDVNVYSFALKPEEHQPSGTCNFSRIDTAHLQFSAATASNGAITVYAVNYNVLRVMSGMGGLAYSN